jgi:hypothetical membrane protein
MTGYAGLVWPLLAAVAFVTFIVAVVDAGIRNPGYRPLSEAVDALGAQNAVAPNAMQIGFVALAVATVAAGIALLRALRSTSCLVGSAIVVAAGLGEAVLGFVRQDCSTARESCAYAEVSNTLSTEHSVHRILAVGLALALVVAIWLLAAGLRRDLAGDPLARLAMAVAVASTVVFTWFGSELYGGIGGAVEKLLIAIVYGWPVVLAVALGRRRIAAASQPLARAGAGQR